MDRGAWSDVLNLEPLGVPTLIIADDPQLIAAARAAYVHWRAEAPHSEPLIELRLEIGGASPSAGVCDDIAVDGSRLSLHTRGASGQADASTLRASAIMSRDVVDDTSVFAEVIDTLLLFLLARHGRTPIHASAFMLRGEAVVLAGKSGSGKSTLALAAASLGFPVLSDDTLFVQHHPSLRLWGFPRAIHVFPADAPAGDHPVRLRNGKLKVAVPQPPGSLNATKCVLVLLERGDALKLSRTEAGSAVEQLMRLDPGFHLLEDESRVALKALAASGAWRLTLSDDPRGAIDLLARTFATKLAVTGGNPIDVA